MLGIIAGEGQLPIDLADAEVAAGGSAMMCVMAGVTPEPTSHPVLDFRIEKLGALFKALKKAGVDRVVFAGAVRRPSVDAKAFDVKTMTLAPKFLGAVGKGDDALLRVFVSVFEREGFTVLGAHQIKPELTAEAGLLAGPSPSRDALGDAQKADEILTALGPLDLGQGAVVAGGLALGIETLQGTDAMLRFVAETPQSLRRGRGVLVKRPKQDQDLRIDMPAIGPATVEGAVAAGLEGIVISAGGVLIIDREATLNSAAAAGLFVLAR